MTIVRTGVEVESQHYCTTFLSSGIVSSAHKDHLLAGEKKPKPMSRKKNKKEEKQSAM